MDPITIVSLVLQGLDLAAKLRARAQQTKEWTPEQEQKYQAIVDQAFASAAWAPSKPAVAK